jgi:hypothetical protein
MERGRAHHEVVPFVVNSFESRVSGSADAGRYDTADPIRAKPIRTIIPFCLLTTKFMRAE